MPRVIYRPRGRAAEYAQWAVNPWVGCDHGCTYCYGPQTLKITPEEFRVPRLKTHFFDKLEKDARDLAGDPEPILLCFIGDPYMPSDSHSSITRHTIRFLQTYNLRVRILTKGGFRSQRDFDLLTDRDFYGATLTFADTPDSQHWEPHAAPPGDRIYTLAIAHHRGIPTWVSLEPVIYPAQTLELIKRTHTFVDEYRVGKLNYRPTIVNWQQFAQEVIALLTELDCAYYIKKDLYRFCPPGTPQRREKKREVATPC